jgi:hypothetical protein
VSYKDGAFDRHYQSDKRSFERAGLLNYYCCAIDPVARWLDRKEKALKKQIKNLKGLGLFCFA